MRRVSLLIIMILLFTTQLWSLTNEGCLGLTVSVYTGNASVFFDDLNSHFWWGEKPGWADEVTVSWVNFDNRDCIKVNVTNVGNNYGFFRTDHFFRSENWESPQITNVKCDIYLASGDTGISVKLELFDNNNTMIEQISPPGSLLTGSWVTVTWTLNQGLNYSDVAKCQIVVADLNGSDAVLYFDNLKIMDNTLNEYDWDDFNDESSKWLYADTSDATNFSPEGWYGACEAVTHNNVEGPGTNAGCLYMRWNAALVAEEYAQARTKDLGLNIDGFTKLEARVRCTSTSANINFGFDDYEAHNLESAMKNVTVADQWETIVWDLPSETFNWSNVKKILLIVRTDVVAAGEIFIDNIQFRLE